MPPINGLRVRKALSMAIDREAFIGTLLPEGTLLATALFPPPTLGWNEEVQSRKYAPEGARQLLEEAGADGVPVDTKMTLVARPGNFPNLTEVMEAIQQQLHEGASTSICNSMRSP
ncbi:ABC transporter substrate-binding protein [Paracoccus pantotrophus]